MMKPEELTLEGGLPLDAIRRCRDDRAEATPFLLGILREAAEHGVGAPEQCDQLFLAAHLLGEFAEPRAFRPLIRLISDPDVSAASFGRPCLIYTMPGILIATCDGDVAPLEETFLNTVDEDLARLVFGAWIQQAAAGRVARHSAERRLRDWAEKIPPDWVLIRMLWLGAAARLGFASLRRTAEQAFSNWPGGEMPLILSAFDGELADAADMTPLEAVGAVGLAPLGDMIAAIEEADRKIADAIGELQGDGELVIVYSSILDGRRPRWAVPHPAVAALAEARTLTPELLRYCSERSAELLPLFQDILDRARGNDISRQEHEALFLILHLLAHLEHRACFGPLTRWLVRGDVEDALGDAITETLPRILSTLYDGHRDDLETLILDAEDAYVADAALAAWTYLVAAGAIDRAHAEGFLTEFPLEDEDSHLVAQWAVAVTILRVDALRPKIEEAYSARLIDPTEIGLDDLERIGRREPLAAAIKEGAGPFGNVFDELARFDHASRQEQEPPPKLYDPAANPYLHVGRNDPCPCGSGRKFKKCHGAS